MPAETLPLVVGGGKGLSLFGRNIKTRLDHLHPHARVTLSPQIEKSMSEEPGNRK